MMLAMTRFTRPLTTDQPFVCPLAIWLGNASKRIENREPLPPFRGQLLRSRRPSESATLHGHSDEANGHERELPLILVMLNLFQHPSCRTSGAGRQAQPADRDLARPRGQAGVRIDGSVPAEKWTLKQVQGDGWERGGCDCRTPSMRQPNARAPRGCPRSPRRTHRPPRNRSAHSPAPLRAWPPWPAPASAPPS
jgi:hypothetical protein